MLCQRSAQTHLLTGRKTALAKRHFAATILQFWKAGYSVFCAKCRMKEQIREIGRGSLVAALLPVPFSYLVLHRARPKPKLACPPESLSVVLRPWDWVPVSRSLLAPPALPRPKFIMLGWSETRVTRMMEALLDFNFE